MKTASNFSLKDYNSFGVEAHASKMVCLETDDDLEGLSSRSFETGRDLVLGGGSNILFAGDVPGTVFLNRIQGRTVVEQDENIALVDVSAGENWHEFVLWTLDQGFSGLENLSLIPGLAGAAPMQNIGAYGVEISDFLESVRAYEWQTGSIVDIPAAECDFAYRNSRFKSREPDRFLIVSCRVKLQKQFAANLSYAGLAEELSNTGITTSNAKQVSAQQVSNAVIRIRQRKLPDPALIGNAGSFFKNPEISPDQAEQLRNRFAGLPVYPINDEVSKISAAWLIEHCGWKGFRDGDAGVSDRHALVLVNYGQATGLELYELSRKITRSVFEAFDIKLESEPKIFAQSF